MSGSTRYDDSPVYCREAKSFSPLMIAITAIIVVGCATVATAVPIGVSIVAVFVFAGPHNWTEAQYFLTHMPARWGKLAPYFSLGLIGSLFLAAMFAALPWLSGDSSTTGFVLVAVWNSLLTAWIVSLALLRSRQNPRRDWPFLIPIGFVFVAVNWMAPIAWSLALVYLHPLLAIAFLDRELQRRSLVWRQSFRYGLLLIPVCLIVMAAFLANSPDIPTPDLLTWQIAHHAGAGVISGISTHFLIAVHVFLELLHYLIWVMLIPLLSQRSSLLRFSDVPLARRSLSWRRLLMIIVALGAVAVLLLWASFLVDYPWTRDVYFTIAILHVLMEIPFLLRSL